MSNEEPTVVSDWRVVDHKLKAARFLMSPNQGTAIRPTLLLMHYTAGRSFDKTVALMRNPDGENQRSAHLVLARDGVGLVQLVAFNKAAWHAGRSEYRGRIKCNSFSIGIELENFGYLKKDPHGVCRTWFGEPVAQEEVFWYNGRHWHSYTEPQLAALESVVRALLIAYPSITAIAGHSDVTANKLDPGPAFPMERYTALLPPRGPDDRERHSGAR